MNTDSDILSFADEEGEVPARADAKTWKLLIVDDEPSVHEVTRLTLSSFEFEGGRLEFLSAYSAAEARRQLQEHPDIALVLLDVVMESDHAGLQLAHHIRRELGNSQVRIVLRTGQPGQAPEEQVVRDYDINDYREKTELTRRKFYTTVYSALRSYRDIIALDRNRRGLEKVIESSSSIFKMRSLDQFASGLMHQVCSVLKLDDPQPSKEVSAFMVAQSDEDPDRPVVVTGIGRYRDLSMSPLAALDQGALARVDAALASESSSYFDDACLFVFRNQCGQHGLIYVAESFTPDDAQKQLLEIFCSNICIAYSNVSLNEELEHTQTETVNMLGTVAEFRSSETANHVIRVGKYAGLLARKLGLPLVEAERIELAAPLHDIGKIGIPDRILMKPGRLSDDEFETMKRHAAIGYHMLKSSKRPLLQAAAQIAHQHQEKWDGSGYPQQLAGEDIHLYGRIVALADVFDALRSKRCYKDAWSMEQVIDYLKSQRGQHFDPRLVDLLLDDVEAFLAIAAPYLDDDKKPRGLL